MLLNGDFERAFSQQGVSFDSRSGNFEVTPHPSKRIGLNAEGIYRKWTKKALERAGFEVFPAKDVPELKCRSEPIGRYGILVITPRAGFD